VRPLPSAVVMSAVVGGCCGDAMLVTVVADGANFLGAFGTSTSSYIVERALASQGEETFSQVADGKRHRESLQC
jgi:hypothetical protein